MEKISKLSPAQEAEIPNFIARWVSQAAVKTDRKKATAAVKAMYKKMGEQEPIVVFGQSPFATAVMAALFFELTKKEGKEDGQLRDQLRDQLYDQLYGQLRGQLDDQLYDQLYDQLDDQLRGQLRDQLDGQLYDQLDDQLRDQLDGQLDDQLRGQLYDQLDDQLRDQLYDQLYGQLYDQLYDQLYGQLRGQLYGQLYGQLRGQLYDQLYGQLKEINKHWYMTTWWLAWAGWYDYGQYIGVEFDKKTYDLFMAFVTNVGFIIPYKGVAFVSEAPTKIRWDAGRLHYDHAKAVEYQDGWGIYMLRGVRFNEKQYNAIVGETLSLEDLAKNKYDLGDEQRVVAIQMLRPDRLLEQVNAKLINESELTGTKLYQVDNFMGTTETEYCIRMSHPSIEDRQYIEWVEPKVGKVGRADYAQAVAFGVAEEDLYVTAVKA